MNGVWHGSNFLLIILDNSTTAMTGFQPHPGAPSQRTNAGDREISIEIMCRSIGAKTVTHDPFDTDGTAHLICKLLSETGAKVLILRHKCALTEGKKGIRKYDMVVDQSRCLGDACGCASFCIRFSGALALLGTKEREWRQSTKPCAQGAVCAPISVRQAQLSGYLVPSNSMPCSSGCIWTWRTFPLSLHGTALILTRSPSFKRPAHLFQHTTSTCSPLSVWRKYRPGL